MDAIGIESGRDSWRLVHIRSSFFGLKVAEQKTFAAEVGKRSGELASFISGKGLDGAPVAVVLSRECSITKVLEIPALGQDSIDGILRYELEKHLPITIDEVYYGYKVLSKKGNLYSLIVGASSKNRVDALREELASEGITPSLICAWHTGFLDSLAFSGSFGKEGRTSVVIAGSDPVSIDAYSGRTPVYSKLFRNADSDGKGVMKRELGLALASLGAADNAPIQNLFLSGKPGEDIISSLPETLRDSLSTLDIKGIEPSYEAAFGGALAAAGKGEYNTDLCGACAEVKTAGYFSTLSLSGAVLLLFFTVIFSYALKDTLTLRGLDRSISELKSGSSGGADAGAEKRIKNLEAITGASSPGVLDYMKELTEILPDHTWITSLEYANGIVHIEGLSGDASSLLIKLESSKHLEGFEFTSPVTRVSHGKERFRLKSKVKGWEGKGA